MTKIITVSLRERKIVLLPQKRGTTEFLEMAHCGGWMLQLSGWALYIILFGISPITGDRTPEKGNTSRIFALDVSPTQHSWAKQRLARQRDQLEIMQVACQHDLWGAWGWGGVGGDSGWLGWSSFWWTQEWRGHTRANLALVAPLIKPLFMQSSRGTYSKYWSCFDRVFSPLNNPPAPPPPDSHPHHPTQMPQQRCHTYQYSKAGEVLVRNDFN